MITKQSLADAVAQQLTDRIGQGEFAVGEKLPTEPALMELFGVGRSTVREAIRKLTHSGMVRVQQGLGTFVLKAAANESLTERLLRSQGKELNEVRELLELKIAEKAARNRTQEDIAEMKMHLEERQKTALAHQAAQCIQADIDFHLCIAKAAKSDILLDLYKTVAGHLQQYFQKLLVDTEKFIASQALHEDLLQSIIDQDPKQAWQAAAKITGQQAILD
ncbi:DNA-binding FadR family transcriptional regulator [Dyadobacter jejuensis]|uniref:DNA-binding FadR family transcriptional regulator n=1 Tax=Dyadobacter jejuensis TaxID=1082580 RepID=A0A316ARL7_9BACT|nr:GntR family transcriptional regulator [Dyadobacter jejuensis]PWJ59884.1 DNA-binding FadR family transcriptional regulator [Dyadobacter jejuensis]